MRTGREAREAPRKLINEILESRAVELFEMVRGELARVGMQRAIASGLVISGGGALLSGICDVAERVLECPARMGLAQGFLDWPEELNDPAWTDGGRACDVFGAPAYARWMWRSSRSECWGGF